jgi:dihydroxyacetone kinase-like protein
VFKILAVEKFTNKAGAVILEDLYHSIHNNKQFLSDIDGMTGDGDHGINMNKGFTMCREELNNNPGDLAHGLNVLSNILMMKIGGSMGPLYGKFFKAVALSLQGKEEIGIVEFGDSLNAAVGAIKSISPAKPGDKTLMDTLVPGVESFNRAREEGKSFSEALEILKEAAKEGRDRTKEMVAKIGRASRLGERSRGVLDAGATSCFLILETFSNSIRRLID